MNKQSYSMEDFLDHSYATVSARTDRAVALGKHSG